MVLKYKCIVCNTVSHIDEDYLKKEYVILKCCSVRCKQKFKMTCLEKTHLPTDVNQIIINF